MPSSLIPFVPVRSPSLLSNLDVAIDKKQSNRNRFLGELLRTPSFRLPMVQLSQAQTGP